MKYCATLTYNHHSIGSNFSGLVEKEDEFAHQIDMFRKDTGDDVIKNDLRHPTSIHPHPNGMGISLCFSVSFETGKYPYTLKNYQQMFESLDKELTVVVIEL
jgi:hypothetical protein